MVSLVFITASSVTVTIIRSSQSSLIMLPPELISYILSVSLTLHPRPVHLLRLSSYFYDVSIRLLYNSLQFQSYTQIERFLATYGRQPLRIPCPPRVIELDVDNNAQFNLFLRLRDLFLFCTLATGAEVDQQGRLVLDLLNLRLHSLSQDPNPGTIYDTLCAIKWVASVLRSYIADFISQSTEIHLDGSRPSSPLFHRRMFPAPSLEKCRMSL